MKPSVYLETSVISYLAARPSTDAIKAARQAISRQLWACRDNYVFCVSDVVRQEATVGHPDAVQARLDYLNQITSIQTPIGVESLAKQLIGKNVVPAIAYVDAMHIACAALSNIKIIASWNFKHIAGLAAKQKIEHALLTLNIVPPQIVTPEQLLGDPS